MRWKKTSQHSEPFQIDTLTADDLFHPRHFRVVYYRPLVRLLHSFAFSGFLRLEQLAAVEGGVDAERVHLVPRQPLPRAPVVEEEDQVALFWVLLLQGRKKNHFKDQEKIGLFT